MRSETLTVQQIFQDRRQYRVPFYQRAYVWNREDQWTLLLEDIKSKADARIDGGTPTPHFLGAVVVEQQPRAGIRGVETLHIIDGQQRLTTLQYTLIALLIALQETGIKGFDSTIASCVLNGNPDTMTQPEIEKYKVWPTFRDRASYKIATSARTLDALRTSFPHHFTQQGTLRKIGITHPPSLDSIWFFAEQFIAYLKIYNSDIILATEALATAILQDLKFVLISLESGDDAQVIFETMNGRGARLHATDLIRNFIFMRADQDKDNAQILYKDHWQQFENKEWSIEERRGRLKKPRLEWLIYTSLQTETRSDIDLPRLYSDYKLYALNKGTPLGAEAQLQTLEQYADHYTALTHPNGSSLPIARFGKRLAAYDITTVYPLALLISIAQVSDTEKAAMFNDLISYIVRRAICGLTTKNYNNTFMGMLRELGITEIRRESLIKYMLSLSGEISRWPNDSEFLNACKTARIYDGRLDTSKTRMFLIELEGQMRSLRRSEEPEIPELLKVDIDHIMPRSWYNYWPLPCGSSATYTEEEQANITKRAGLELTKKQEEILDRSDTIRTLGNLTLLNLSVNREAQNREFLKKRDLLIRNTNLSLNIDLINKNKWEIKEIRKRGEKLSKLAVELYPIPI